MSVHEWMSGIVGQQTSRARKLQYEASGMALAIWGGAGTMG
ncbi:MAG: hypothetical protein OJF49_000956 [Ktedonobacterales bacterium]|nr:MAG: hypothetical protein OJF49_000956 [Ktedonobacterales bacterium]